MKKYVCTVCGYVYNPADGDPDSGIKPGTAFEDIPEDWVCPVCGAEQGFFRSPGVSGCARTRSGFRGVSGDRERRHESGGRQNGGQ